MNRVAPAWIVIGMLVSFGAGMPSAGAHAMARGHRPHAVAAATPKKGLGPLTVSFSSRRSTDRGGKIMRREWQFGDGSVPVTQSNPTHTYARPGKYVAVLTIVDDQQAESSARIKVHVKANQRPKAIATATPSAGDSPLTVSFSSAGSHDPDGTITAYAWRFGDGSPVSTAANPSHTYTSDGTYTAALTVMDDHGAIGKDSVIITVGSIQPPPGGSANQAPVAQASGTPSSGKSPLTVAFSSAGSSDADGTITGYSWDFGDGSPVSTSANPSHTYTAPGNYVATLTVTGSDGLTDTATVPTSVVANQAPVAQASGTPSSGKSPLTVAFSSSGSSDADGTITGYSWDFGDGSPVSASANPSHTYAAPGNYIATLTVTDDDGATSTATVPISAVANQTPTVVESGNPTAGKSPLTVAFSSSGSSDSDGTITGYSWDFGDGSPLSTSANPSHTYTSPGNYFAVLTVTDNDGATSSTGLSIAAMANQAPTAVASGSPTCGTAPLTVAFSSSGSSDPDGTITGYSWNFGDGSAVSASANPSHTYSPGIYSAVLTVTDNDGATSTASVPITVGTPVTTAFMATPFSRTGSFQFTPVCGALLNTF